MKKLLVTFLLTFTFSMLLAAQTSAEGYTTRLGGQDRFEVAVNVSKKGWSTSANVVLANYTAYADALAAAPLAYKLNGPILLTHAGKLTSVTKQEIIRLNAKSVTIVGGKASVSDQVITELRAMGISVNRISGQDRYDVANNIAKSIGKKDRVVVAYGLNFPDALAIAPYAARNGYPILLTNTNSMPDATKSIISQWGVNQTIVVGGTGSVSQNVFNSLPNAIRIDGKDRFAVASNIANRYYKSQSQAFVATGMNFADALTGSVLAAKRNNPILLTSSSIPAATKDSIINNGYQTFTILGGSASVSTSISNILGGPAVGQTIMIDPGHGGSDPGASGYGMLEKDIVLDVSKRVNARLYDSLAKVMMTRNSDTYPTLDERVQMAHSQGADLFVSIHVNAYSGSSPNGTETYYNTAYASADSKLLAEEIQKELVKAMGTNDRGVKQGSFYVIKYTKIPSVLVEIAFISNPEDAKKLANNTFRQRAADAIYKGIMNYYNKK
ncbi:cell wall-binding repeat-containing protein [Cytobacillus oceanisediminis]|uniref:N-acetylmuramoyl-L-alanine amidase n=1 Tax=Cytobacillus oceanisediminis 2691 TaxID=1196031 RepID=A0A160MG39_9BACI|nr:cell wall-binding repeat-containing protein [Cytobacillus oceanisediminis]AND42249.1 N-acetylmuramoyl-L-alanine amidase [Cytobacillus oceanisediminis 2691]